jgi:hypothetical protein
VECDHHGKFGRGVGNPTPSGHKPSSTPATGRKPAKIKSSSILSPTTFAAREQRHAEKMQVRLADEIDEGADSIDGNAPADVERVERGGHLNAVEVKTKLRGKSVVAGVVMGDNVAA